MFSYIVMRIVKPIFVKKKLFYEIVVAIGFGVLGFDGSKP